MTSEWYGKKADKAVPLTDTFIRACCGSGALTPPHETDRATRITGYAVVCMVAIGAAISWIAFLWR